MREVNPLRSGGLARVLVVALPTNQCAAAHVLACIHVPRRSAFVLPDLMPTVLQPEERCARRVTKVQEGEELCSFSLLAIVTVGSPLRVTVGVLVLRTAAGRRQHGYVAHRYRGQRSEP